jgi:periplasmic divalent cation tolerance protein
VSALLCLSTCSDQATARRIAETLVGERLAACVNLVPGMRSVYRWKGQVETSDEVLMLIKTSAQRLPDLRERLLALHPYELPELIAVEIADGLPAYLDWIAAESAVGSGSLSN